MSIVHETRVSFTSEGRLLIGDIARPGANTHDVPGVVLLHGFTSNRDESSITDHGETMFQHAAKQITRAGFATLRFDFRGHGESEGLFEDITVDNLISDTFAAIDYLSAFPGVDTSCINLLGQSMGGLVAACASYRDKRVRTVSLWNAPSHPLYSFSALMKPDTVAKAIEEGSVEFFWDGKGPFRLRKPFFESLIRISPLGEIARFDGRLLVIAGTNDSYVSPQPQMGEAFIRAHLGQHELMILEADHTFNIASGYVDLLDRTLKKNIAWFNKSS